MVRALLKLLLLMGRNDLLLGAAQCGRALLVGTTWGHLVPAIFIPTDLEGLSEGQFLVWVSDLLPVIVRIDSIMIILSLAGSKAGRLHDLIRRRGHADRDTRLLAIEGRCQVTHTIIKRIRYSHL